MSRFLISLFLFLLINVLAVKALPVVETVCQSKIQEHTWTEWALIDFAKQKDNPSPIVFLGSSLMLMPINLADAHWLNCAIDGATHHTSVLFDHMFNGNKKQAVANFNFALPGLMPSDAYLINKLMLGDNNHPQLIVYGLGPRDFLDNLLLTPVSTDPYRCLAPYLPKSLLLSFVGQDWQLKANYFLKQFLPLYDQKDQITSELFKTTGDCVPSLAPKISMQTLHNLLPGYNPMAIRRCESLFSPDQVLDPDRFAKNINEYRQRYHQVNWDTFTCQTKFFFDFLKTAANNKTKVLIAAMPITSVNRYLLPDYIYAAYKENLRVLSKSSGADFIDLDDGGYFGDQDFLDTVHLNATGGKKLLGLFSDYIVQHKLVDREKRDHSRLADTGIKI